VSHPFSKPVYQHDPNLVGAPGTGGYLGLEDWVRNLGLGRAGVSAKEVLQAMNKGNYQGLAGTLLSPIHDRFATNLREGERNAMLGANALYAGTQPALMAGLQNTLRNQMAEGEGLAYGQAIPALWSTAGGMFQNALNALEGNQLAGLEGATRARAGQLTNEPGWFDRLGQVAGTAGQIAGLAMGIPQLGGAGTGGAGAAQANANLGAAPNYMSPSNPFGYAPPGAPGYNGFNPGNYVPPLSGGG